MAKTKDVWQPMVKVYDQNGDMNGMALATHLLAKIDRNEDGRIIGTARLDFATYPGLEAEWLAGVATPILEAALSAELGNIDFPTDQMSAAQRVIIDVQIAAI